VAISKSFHRLASDHLEAGEIAVTLFFLCGVEGNRPKRRLRYNSNQQYFEELRRHCRMHRTAKQP
jgi:hypothetical protein